MKVIDSPVDKVIFLQVLTATGNVPSHMQKIQHGQGGGLVLWEDKRAADEGRQGDGKLALFVRRLRPVMLLPQGPHPFKNHSLCPEDGQGLHLYEWVPAELKVQPGLGKSGPQEYSRADTSSSLMHFTLFYPIIHMHAIT